MKLVTVQCNHCSAPLEVGESTRFVTCAHCGSRLAVQRTESSIFTEQLDRLHEKTSEIAGNLEVIRLQNELERLDREWGAEREGLMTRDPDGRLRPPSRGASAAGGLVAVAFGAAWMIITSRTGAPGPFSLFGLVFILGGALGVFFGQSAANRYRSAEAKHQAARQALVAELERLQGRIAG